MILLEGGCKEISDRLVPKLITQTINHLQEEVIIPLALVQVPLHKESEQQAVRANKVRAVTLVDGELRLPGAQAQRVRTVLRILPEIQM